MLLNLLRWLADLKQLQAIDRQFRKPTRIIPLLSAHGTPTGTLLLTLRKEQSAGWSSV